MSAVRLHGVKVPHRKTTAGSTPVRMGVPSVVTIPMSMHIGVPAEPVVKPGDQVKVGQLVAVAKGAVSSPVYSSVSGKVKKIDDMLMSNGRFMKAVTIEPDGAQELYEGLAAPEVSDYASFIAAVRESGVVGLGGAGFPTAVKLDVKDLTKIEAVIVNGAECEPYVTSDTRTMLDDTELVWDGVQLLRKYLNAKRVVIAIEDNKPECIRTFKGLAQGNSGVEVVSMPSLYPQGGEKVLIYNVLGKIVPEGGLPIDVGAIVINCTTLAAIAKYIEKGIPLIEKCVTVDGSAVKEPKNVIVPIGTPVSEVFDFCGGFKEEPRKILYGGPMMGIALPGMDYPIMKNNNAILAFGERDAVTPEPTACIRCGSCIESCPLNLMPTEFAEAYENRDVDRLRKLKVNLCMECGCCSYACPAKRPLVQTNRLAKALLTKDIAEKKAQAASAAAKKDEREEVASK